MRSHDLPHDLANDGTTPAPPVPAEAPDAARRDRATNQPRPGRATRAEGRIQITLMVAVGAVAAAASWSHVVDLAAEHGQTGWRSYATAAVVETAAVSAGLELRRRRRAGLPVAGPGTVLVTAVVLQLACQLAAAEASVWGWVLGAVPLVTFLALADAALSRVPTDTAPEPAPVTASPSPAATEATEQDREPDRQGHEEAAERAGTTAARPVPVRAARRAGAASSTARSTARTVARLRTKHPEWTAGQIAERAGVSERTVRRHLNASPPTTTRTTTTTTATSGTTDETTAGERAA